MNSGNTYTVLSLLGSLVLFVLILVLAWFCVRWLGGQYRLNTAGSRVKVLERIALAPDRSLLVVRAGGQVLLLGVTSQHIEKSRNWTRKNFRMNRFPRREMINFLPRWKQF